MMAVWTRMVWTIHVGIVVLLIQILLRAGRWIVRSPATILGVVLRVVIVRRIRWRWYALLVTGQVLTMMILSLIEHTRRLTSVRATHMLRMHARRRKRIAPWMPTVHIVRVRRPVVTPVV